jgi:hypothetical protein
MWVGHPRRMARTARLHGLIAGLAVVWAGGCAIPIIGARSHAPTEEPTDRATAQAAHGRARAAGPRVPVRQADALAGEGCEERLAGEGVRFERVAPAAAHGVEQPVRLLGPLDGVEVSSRDHSSLHAILDCRLALALLSWAPTLRRAGVKRIEHYSIYRPGARVETSGRESGHARGLAIDAARFYLQNGSVLDVQTDWEERERGSAPCPRRPEEAWPSRLLRGIVCDAVDQQLFQIVITPNHDRAHDNHVHLERKPEVSWTYVR